MVLMDVSLVDGVAPAVVTDLLLDLVPDDRCWSGSGSGSGGWWWWWGLGLVNYRGGCTATASS